MVLEISMYFEKTAIGIFGTIPLSHFLFTSFFAIFCTMLIERIR